MASWEGTGQVAGIIRLEATYRPTGKAFKDIEAHLFTFDQSGRVIRFRHFVDTHQHLLATR